VNYRLETPGASNTFSKDYKKLEDKFSNGFKEWAENDFSKFHFN
jgi:hypothetical protein